MIEPRAWGLIAVNTGEIVDVTLDKSEADELSPKHVIPFTTVADVLAALRQPSEAMIEAAVGTATECDACIRPQYSVDALWNAMLDQFEKEQSGNASINAAKRRYEAANPLGGPARMFEAIAERIRSGEDYYAVLADYGVTVGAK